MRGRMQDIFCHPQKEFGLSLTTEYLHPKLQNTRFLSIHTYFENFQIFLKISINYSASVDLPSYYSFIFIPIKALPLKSKFSAIDARIKVKMHFRLKFSWKVGGANLHFWF